MQKHVLEQHPDADLSVQFVWVRAFQEDDDTVARTLAGQIHDPRVHHYWDRPLLLGRALADQLLPDFELDFTWDVYLFYDRDANWGEQPPAPVDWMHLMKLMAIDHYCPPGDLGDRLDGLMRRLGVDEKA